jgi:hypothetical protein
MYISQEIFTKVIYVLPQYITITLTKNVVQRASVKIMFTHKNIRNILETINLGPQNNSSHLKEMPKCRNCLWHDPIKHFCEELSFIRFSPCKLQLVAITDQ